MVELFLFVFGNQTVKNVPIPILIMEMVSGFDTRMTEARIGDQNIGMACLF